MRGPKKLKSDIFKNELVSIRGSYSTSRAIEALGRAAKHDGAPNGLLLNEQRN